MWENINRITNFYNHYWPLFFNGQIGCEKALLLIIINENGGDDLYTHQNNSIRLVFTLDEINDENFGEWNYENEDFERWFPRWAGALAHEMFHEYQFKVNPDASERGIYLYNLLQETPSHIRILPRPPRNLHGFDGDGHNDIFYSVLSEKSHLLNISDENMLRESAYDIRRGR